MISEKLLQILQDDIQIYDEKNGKDYLIVFSKGKNDIIKYCQISFYHYNFWHLIGCEVKSDDTFESYIKCKNRENVSEQVFLVHSYAEAESKHQTFGKVFDFVKNAKQIKIGYIGECPEKFYLTMSLGNENGFVGYDYPRNGKSAFLIPKSVQDKKVSDVSDGLNKILFILSKKQSEKVYQTVEYEIKDGVATEYLSNLPQDINAQLG